MAAQDQSGERNRRADHKVPGQREIPPSVEARAADSQADAQREEQQKINMQDVLNQMAIQSGKINA